MTESVNGHEEGGCSMKLMLHNVALVLLWYRLKANQYNICKVDNLENEVFSTLVVLKYIIYLSLS